MTDTSGCSFSFIKMWNKFVTDFLGRRMRSWNNNPKTKSIMLRLMLLDFAPKIIHCYNTYFSIFLQFLSKQGGLKGIIAGPHQGSAGYCTGLSVTHPRAERVTFFVTTLRHLKSCNIIPHTGARAFPAPIFPGHPNRIDYVVVHTHLLNEIIH